MEKKEILNSKMRRAPKKIKMHHKEAFWSKKKKKKKKKKPPPTTKNNQSNQICNLLEELREWVFPLLKSDIF